jgi:hypothetical protein
MQSSHHERSLEIAMTRHKVLSTTLKHWFSLPAQAVAVRGTWRDIGDDSTHRGKRSELDKNRPDFYRSEAFAEDLAEYPKTTRQV